MKEFLHKIVKIFLILLLITAGLTILVVGVVFVSHRVKLGQEEPLLANPPGEMVEVDGHKMHVYVTGDADAEQTIVFLHGNGMADASIAMRPLFDELASYRLVYVDRPGNGFSEAGCEDKSIGNLTDETRQAIQKLGIQGSVILFAQTGSGVEACYWAQTYPEEVEAIVGLDTVFPEEYEDYQNEDSFKYMIYAFGKLGITRHIDSAYPENRYHLYSDKEQLVRKALISRGSYTRDMYREDQKIAANAVETEKLGFPEKIPIFVVLSNPIKEPYLSTDASAKADLDNMKEKYPGYDFEQMYNESNIEFMKKYPNIEYEEMAGPSAMYEYAPDKLAEAIKDFLQKH